MNKKAFVEITVMEAMIVVMFIMIPLSAIVPRMMSSKIECKLYNEKYNKEYTTWDFFWSGETIKSFLSPGVQTTQNVNVSGAMPVKLVN